VQEHAIDITRYRAQHFDAFRYGRSVFNQIPTSRCVQSQDGAGVSGHIIPVEIWKTFQCVVFLENLGHLLLFHSGQPNSANPIGTKLEGFESLLRWSTVTILINSSALISSLWMARLSSDVFSTSKVTMYQQKAEKHDSVARYVSTANDLRALLVRKKKKALHHKAKFPLHRGTYLSFRCSSVVFFPSPSFIAVHSDSFIELCTSTESVLSPVLFPKAVNIGDQSKCAATASDETI
jgi:hypothetical protein